MRKFSLNYIKHSLIKIRTTNQSIICRKSNLFKESGKKIDGPKIMWDSKMFNADETTKMWGELRCITQTQKSVNRNKLSMQEKIKCEDFNCTSIPS